MGSRPTIVNSRLGFNVEIESQGTAAFLRDLRPASRGGPPLTVDLVLEELRVAGVVAGIDRKALERALRQVADGRLVPRILVASALKRRPGRPGRVEVLVADGDPVTLGDLVARLEPGEPGQDGVFVTGQVQPSDRGADVCLDPGDGTALDANGRGLSASIYGWARVAGTQVSVEPLVVVSGDGMEAALDLRAGARHSPEVVRAALAAAGVEQGVDQVAIEGALADASEGRPVVARGRPPEPGQDGRVDLKVGLFLRAGKLDERDHMDYRDRGFGESRVAPGQVVAELLPPVPGEDGVSVTGETLPAPPGRAARLDPGENVSVRDGRHYVARADGIALLHDDILSVWNMLHIQGDVDYRTGHIHVPDQGVVVDGSVRSGFQVVAAGPLVVKGDIEDAVVRCVRGFVSARGILQKGGGMVEAAGGVDAGFAQNARIRAGKDVEVSGGMVHCDVAAAGWIRAPGPKGRAVGGVLRAGQGVDVTEAGSQAQVATVLKAGAGMDREGELLAQLALLRRGLAEAAAGDRAELEERLRGLEHELAALHHGAEERPGVVRVRGVTHPGVRVAVGSHEWLCLDAVERAQYTLDRVAGGVKPGPLEAGD